MEHLIANTGLQFITREVELNPAEPFLLPSGRSLKYTFSEMTDFMTGLTVFDLLCYHREEKVYVALGELTEKEALERTTAGFEVLDEAGVPAISAEAGMALFGTLPADDESLFSVTMAESLRVPDPEGGHSKVTALSLLMGKWLPMPMYEHEGDGNVLNSPTGWCRVKIDDVGPGEKKGRRRYRLTWAFDTATTSDPLSSLRPCFYDAEEGPKTFKLCAHAGFLLDFLSTDGDRNAVATYVTSLLGLDVDNDTEGVRFRYLAWYIYLVSLLRVSGAAPEVALYKGTAREVGVDLVLDIGNSRTCGVLFEEGDFTKAMMLELRDMEQPHRTYGAPFDMRIVFRRADFGGALLLGEDVFDWKSFVRVGEEARRLVYRSREEADTSELCTNYSSPKRYLWDHKPFDGKWRNLISVTDPTNVNIDHNIYIEGLSEQFDAEGRFVKDGPNFELGTHYSRSSLMTFVMIEVLQQALCQANGVRFRDKHGNIDCRRYLRNVIITSPTAMPLAEQVTLRRAAADAWKAIMRLNPTLRPVTVCPSPEALSVTPDDVDKDRQWSYDEASCCQLVYLYAEIAQRYDGEIQRFFDMKGHVRPELKAEGYEKKALTIGSIDIGAGTTDIMICAYEYEGAPGTRLIPVPKFWDSFYLAGDDILRKLISTFVIEGDNHESPTMGCVQSALENRLLAMTDDELRAMPCLAGNGLSAGVYRAKVDAVTRAATPAERDHLVRVLASNMVHDFFGADSNLQTARDRRNRNDFNTQISLPIAQQLLDFLRCHRPSRIYTFDELFSDVKPARYLLDGFAAHFGFRFEELDWRYDPDRVAADVKAVLEPLMKQLSVVLYAYHCDVLVLAGRPTSLDTVTELFIKYYPLSPDRLIRLGEYRVGTWYPFADGQGYFFDQKSVVAVGAMVGYTASHTGFNGLVLDFDRMIHDMRPTTNYLGLYSPKAQQVKESILTPDQSAAMVDIHVFPTFIGCKQLDDPTYQARPLYALYNNSKSPMLRLCLSRNFHEDREVLTVDDVSDNHGNSLPADSVSLVQQSLADDGKYWLDKGEFELSLK